MQLNYFAGKSSNRDPETDVRHNPKNISCTRCFGVFNEISQSSDGNIETFRGRVKVRPEEANVFQNGQALCLRIKVNLPNETGSKVVIAHNLVRQT